MGGWASVHKLAPAHAPEVCALPENQSALMCQKSNQGSDRFMQSLIELTDGLDKLRSIVAEFPSDSPHWNEAQNRFQFIDRLLIECLGWSHSYIEVEKSDESGGKTDYVLGRPAKAVLEAKREARHFDDLPAAPKVIVRKLRPLIEACPVFRATVHQVIPYCTFHGAQIAIVCNGPQLAIFQALTPGSAPLDGECYLFNGLESYIDNFPLLWRLLSPEGISENRAYRQLSSNRMARIPAKASTAIANPMRYRYRSNFQENLRTLASVLLEDIEEHPDVKTLFYNECYVSLEANARNLLLSKNIIAARYKRIGDDGVTPTPLTSKAAGGRIQLDDDALAASLGSRPIVVVGDVGVGKTSFFENLFEQIDATGEHETIFIHINLGTKANLSDDIKGYILSEIPEILKREYGINIYEMEFVRSLYYSDLRDFDAGVEGALKGIDDAAYTKARVAFLQERVSRKDAHLHVALGHLSKGQRKQIILVIDNADQRKFETQQEAFLIAQELAASRNMIVFVALRPSTFYVSKLTGALSGYQNRVLTISPPPADEVLRRRISFAVRVAEGKIAPAALVGIRLNLANIVSFLNATLRSIRSNESIKTFLSNITGGNTRLVIELITGFVGSPNVESERIVRIEQETGNYKVPLHEFTKHALLGDYAYYNPLSSFVACNLFDVSAPDPAEHFLSSLVISYLAAPSGRRDNDGFELGSSILSEMARRGFVEDQVRACLRRLAERRLIETPHGHYREVAVDDGELTDNFNFRATSIGIYHTRYWMGTFAFLDATATDTPIFDDEASANIFKLASSFEIEDRLNRAEIFRTYLQGKWHAANFNVSYFDFEAVMKTQDETFDSVRKHVSGHATRRPR